MTYLKNLFFSAVLAFAATTVAAKDNNYVPGTYLWSSSFGCAYLVIGETLTYHYDKDCDGGKDYVATRVLIEGSKIYADGATLIVSSYNAAKIEGTWVWQGQYQATFNRQIKSKKK